MCHSLAFALLLAAACLSGAAAQLEPGVYTIQLQPGTRPTCPDSQNGFLTVQRGWRGQEQLGLTPTPSDWFAYWVVRKPGAQYDFNVMNTPINIQNYGKAQTRGVSWLAAPTASCGPATASLAAQPQVASQSWYITPKPSVSTTNTFYIMKNTNTCGFRFLGFPRAQCSAPPVIVQDGIPAAPTVIFTLVSPGAVAVQGGGNIAGTLQVYFMAPEQGQGPFVYEMEGVSKVPGAQKLAATGAGTVSPEDPTLLYFSFTNFLPNSEYEFHARAKNTLATGNFGPWVKVTTELAPAAGR